MLSRRRNSGHSVPAVRRKTLSALKDDKLPYFWHAAKKAGRPSINALVLLAIMFSHHRLIEAMRSGIEKYGVGIINRRDLDDEKAFTNFKNDFEELKFTTSANQASFAFDIRSILRDDDLGQLARLLFKAKLQDAGWSGGNDVVDECLRVGFNHALGMSEAKFRQWTAGKTENLDDLTDTRDPNRTDPKAFSFKAGHRKRKSGEVVKKGHGETAKARLIHNQLQNQLYAYLVSIHGNPNVGTELTSGPPQTSIDLVVKIKQDYTFYEIKTSKSLRKCIREAVPQLLEYAYWPNDDRAVELVIVSTNMPTIDAENYLSLLRSRFSLPIFHETIDGKTGQTSARI